MIVQGFVTSADFHKVYYEHYKQGHETALVIAHGFYNSKEALLLKQLAMSLNQDYDVIVFDFRGHGQSEGLFSWTSNEYLDLLAIMQFVKAHYQKIGVIGFSLGAASSIIAACKTSAIDSIMSVSGPTEVGRIDYHFWRMNFNNDLFYNWAGPGSLGKGVRLGPFWQKKEKPIELVKKIGTPIFYLHGTRDWVVRPWHSHELYAATAGFKRLHLIEQGGHAEFLFKDYRYRILALIKEWFHETLY